MTCINYVSPIAFNSDEDWPGEPISLICAPPLLISWALQRAAISASSALEGQVAAMSPHLKGAEAPGVQYLGETPTLAPLERILGLPFVGLAISEFGGRGLDDWLFDWLMEGKRLILGIEAEKVTVGVASFLSTRLAARVATETPWLGGVVIRAISEQQIALRSFRLAPENSVEQ